MAARLPNALLRHLHHVVEEPASDRELLARFAERQDQSAFRDLVQRHGALVLGIGRRVLGDHHAAEDVFQATFLVLARKAGSARWQASVGPWLAGVAYRLAAKLRADRHRRQIHEGRAAVPPTVEPDHAVERRELAAIVDEEVQRLPERYRAPVVLCYLGGKTGPEAARELGLSLAATKSRLVRARLLLRRRLARRGCGLSVVVVPVVPLLLMSATVKAATPVALGEAVAGLPAPVLSLAEEMLKAMTAAKVKATIALGLAVVLIAAGAGVLARQAAVEPPQPVLPAEQVEARIPVVGPALPDSPKPIPRDRYGDPLPAGALARMGTVRLRHGNWIAGAAFSPDGKFLASGGADRTLRLWEVGTGKELRRFDHEGAVRSLAFSSDGKTLISADDRATVRFWEVATGKELRRFPVHGGPFGSVSFSPDRHTLAAGDGGGFIRLWETSTGKEIRRFTYEGDAMHDMQSIVFAPDGRTLASGSADKIVRLWDVATGKEIRQLRGHSEAIQVLAFSPDGRTLASGGLSQPELRLWEVATGKEVRQLTGKWGFLAAAFSPDGKTLASGGQDGLVRHWDVTTGKELRQWKAHRGWVSALAFSRDGKTLAATADRVVQTWDLATGKELVPTHGHPEMIWSVALSPEGKLLATADYSTIRFWDTMTGRELRQCVGHPGRGDLIVFAPDGKTLAANGWDRKLRLWDATTGKELRRFEGHRELACGLAFSPDGKWLASSGMDKTLRFWDVATGKEVRQFPGRNEMIRGLAFSPDGKMLATGSMDPWTIRWWDVATGQEIRSVTNLQAAVWSVAFSPDGKTLASASCRNNFIVSYGKDEQIRLWDVATGRERTHFGGHPGGYYQIRFSADGRTLVSAGEDHVVRLWEVATGKERHRFLGHAGPVSSVALSADSRLLASGSSDTTALVWDLTGSAGSQRPPLRLTAAQTAALWADLAADDATRAYQALLALRAAPHQAVPLVNDHLRPVPRVDPQRLARLLASLDSDRFSERSQATKELEQLGELAEPGLRSAFQQSPSLEVRKRLDQLLEKLAKTPLSGDQARTIRAVELLEHVGTGDAQRVLKSLAQGAEGARLTREATAALRRLAARPTPPEARQP